MLPSTSCFLLLSLFFISPASAIFWGSGGGCGCQPAPPPIPCVQPLPCPPPPTCRIPPPTALPCIPEQYPPPPQSTYLPSPTHSQGPEYSANRPVVAVDVDKQPSPPPKLTYVAPSGTSVTSASLGVNSNDITDIYDDALEPLPALATPKKPVATLTTEGIIPHNVFQRRHNLLNRYRMYRALSSRTKSFQRASTTCNNMKLAKIIVKAIIDGDVTESKRSVTRAAETAFHGQQWDVICASGEFSYTIHSRSYCEATAGTITCFAFR